MDHKEINSLIEQLRCGICKDYLNWPPVVLLEDGTSACGKCTPSSPLKNPDGSVVRELTLEQALRKLPFPCKYKSEGCQQRLFFGYVNHEEKDCVYRPFTCPTGNCPWSGSMFGLSNHFAEAHLAMIKNALSFKLQVDKDSEEIILAEFGKVYFIVKYTYNANQAELFIEVNCLTTDEAFYKICMFNDIVNDNGVSLKKEKCLPYISQTCDGLTLNLNKYLPVLENPGCIMVKIMLQIMIKKDDKNDVVPPPNPTGVPINDIMKSLGYGWCPL